VRKLGAPLSVGGVALVIGGALAWLLEGEESSWLPLANILAGIVAVAIAAVLKPEMFAQYGRWINAAWGGIMVLAIVVMVNFLADRYHERLDLTAGQLHSLADLTVETLESLEAPVRAFGFMEAGENEALKSLLEQYASHSGHFEFEMIDPDRQPQRTLDYGVRAYNTLIVESGERQQKLTDLTEKDITNALLKVVWGQEQKIYFTVGHGEKGVGGSEQSYSRLRDRLEEIAYAVEDSLLLARQGDVPDDCSVLVIGGSISAFLENEVSAVNRYLKTGGAVLLLTDPLLRTGLEQVLGEWGVVLGEDFVIDTSGIGSLFGLDVTVPAAMSYDAEHAIVSKHRSGLMTFYELARSVRFEASGSASVSGSELVFTSDQSWAESDLTVLLPSKGGEREVSMDANVDTQGPVSLGVAIQATDGGGRLVVFGDSDFATNQYFDVQGNGDLALNAVSWLAADEKLISIRPKDAGYSPISLTAADSDWIFWISVIIYPLVIAIAGLAVVSKKGRWSVRDLVAAGLGVVISAGIVGLVNFAGERYNARYDFTEEGLFTLHPDTVRLLEQIDSQNLYVSVKTFMAEAEGLRFQQMMDLYRDETRNFDYDIIDPQKRALEVKQYGVRERGTSIIEVTSEGQVRSQRIAELTEEALSNAIQQAVRAKSKTIAFIGGHGEGRLTEVDGEGFSILNGRLKEMAFGITEGERLDKEGALADAQLVGVLSPKTPFPEEEIKVLRAHLARGRDALFLLDPGPQTGLESLLEDYGVEVGADFVVDLSGLGQLLGADVSVPVVLQYGDHPITAKLAGGTMSYFPLTRSVSKASYTPAGSDTEELAFTHQSSWGETDLSPITASGGQVEYDPGTDRPGPLSIAVAVKAEPDSALAPSGEMTRLVVFGDSDFAQNQYFSQQANGELLVSALRWVSEVEDRLSIQDKRPKSNPLSLGSDEGLVILWLAVFAFPFAVALSGFVIMLKRGYETYSGGFASWLIYSFGVAALYYFVLGVVGLSESSLPRGDGYLLLSLVSAAVAYGLFRRDAFSWVIALALSVANAGLAFVAIPNETVQLIFAALFVANACILVWIKTDFFPKNRGD